MQAAHRVAKNTGILYTRMAITIFISLYSTRLLLSGLGANDFGLFNVIGGSIAMLGFLHASMASSSQRFMSHAQGSGDVDKMINIFNVSFTLHLLIGFIVFFVLEIAGLFFFSGFLNIPPDRLFVAKIVYQCVIVSTLFSIISVPYDAVINAHENMLLYSITSIIEALCKLGIAVYISKTTFDRLLVYAILTASLSVSLLLFQRIYCHIKYVECKINLVKYFDKTLFKAMTNFGGWSFLGSFVGLVGNYGSGILINIFFTPIVNAAQGIANQINGQVGAFSTIMLQALNPAIVKSEGAGNRGLVLKATMTGSKLAFSLFALFCIPIFIEMPYILKIWIKSFPQDTVIFCRLLLIKSLLEQPFYVLITSIGAQGNIKKPILIKSIILILPLPITYFLYRMGQPPYIIYVVFIACNLLKDFLNLYFAHTNLGLSISTFFKEVIVRCILITLIIFSLSYLPLFYLNQGLERLAIVLFLSFTTFLISFYFILINNQEQKLIVKIISSVLSKLKRNKA